MTSTSFVNTDYCSHYPCAISRRKSDHNWLPYLCLSAILFQTSYMRWKRLRTVLITMQYTEIPWNASVSQQTTNNII